MIATGRTYLAGGGTLNEPSSGLTHGDPRAHRTSSAGMVGCMPFTHVHERISVDHASSLSLAPRARSSPRAALVAVLLAASHCADAATFEFAGLGRATTRQDIAWRYPNSTRSGWIVHISPWDSHDHVFEIQLAEGNPAGLLRIGFASPDSKYPRCNAIERSIAAKHGAPAESREYREEATQNRVVIWSLEGETVRLQCFRSGGSSAEYSAEAITLFPLKRVSSEPRRKSPAAGQR